MGVTIRQKIKGKGKPWWVFISHNGKRTSRQVGTKDAAKEVAKQIEAKLQLGEFGFEQEKLAPTFKEYADSWIKTTVPATCKQSTVRDYQDILRIHVLPVFGNLNVKDITRGKVKDFLLGKSNEGYAKSTVTHMKNVLSGVLNKAVDNEIIPVNPAHRLGKLFKNSNEKSHIDPLSREELKHFLDTVQTHYPRHYPIFLLLARTGLRVGEALALQWGDIDFHGNFINVQRNLSRGKIETPKNGKTRHVDMSRQLADTLKALKEKRELHGLPKVVVSIKRDETEKEEAHQSEWLFTNGNGQLIDTANLRHRIFNKALQKAKLRKIRIHDLRHTYATLRISKGDDITDVSNQLGHHSVKLTLDVYNHWIPGKKKSEVNGLDDDFITHPSAPYLHPALPEKEKELTNVG